MCLPKDWGAGKKSEWVGALSEQVQIKFELALTSLMITMGAGGASFYLGGACKYGPCKNQGGAQ